MRVLGLLCLFAFTPTSDADERAPVPPNERAKQVKIGKIDFYTDYEQALRIAKDVKKPLWLHFGENPG